MAACPEKSRILISGQQGADPDGRVDSVQAGHDDIGDEHVRLEGRGQLDGLFAGIDGAGLKAALIQNHGQRIGDHPFIVGNQNFGFGSVSGIFSPNAEDCAGKRNGRAIRCNACLTATDCTITFLAETLCFNDTLSRGHRSVYILLSLTEHKLCSAGSSKSAPRRNASAAGDPIHPG